ncbi:MAG: PA14 domain-containing protein [Bacteroidota bacterium]
MNKFDTTSSKLFVPLFLLILFSFLTFHPTSSYAQPSGFVDEEFVNGFNSAIGVTFDANGRMYVWEKNGKVWIVENGVKSAIPLIDLSEEVGNWRDFGLVGFTLDPNFLENGYIYLLYTVDLHYLKYFGTPTYDRNTNEYFKATIGRITRYTAKDFTGFREVDYNSRKILIGETIETGFPSVHESHGIGALAFGTDGTLLATCGDGASYSSVDEGSASETYWQQAIDDKIIPAAHNIGAYRVQIDNSLAGKLVRLDPETGNGVPSNPNYDPANPRSPASRTWGRGLRNPYRMQKRPGTGSHNPEDADPGTFYIGDVGWGTREELNVAKRPSMNFGWPKFEGMTYNPGYNSTTYEPAVHDRPVLDWRRGTARGLINGNIINVGTSQLPGPNFTGNCATGGTWYTGDDFPADYKNTYFLADYGGRWIYNFGFDQNDNPTFSRAFKTNAGPVTGLASNPITGALYYVNRASTVQRISYAQNQNRKPVAVIEASPLYGSSPLSVSFTGSGSYDPDNGTLTYSWDFGDGSPVSTAINPTHVFTALGTVPENFQATLTVTDPAGATATATVSVSLNNTPPVIASTSVDGINTYSLSGPTTLNLTAQVSDQEHADNQLTYSWETALFHNDHSHLEPADNQKVTSATLSPLGCDGVTYWYRISLTVTDAGGLSTTVFKDIYPDCGNTDQTLTFAPVTDKTILDTPFRLTASASSGLPINYYVVSGPATILGDQVSLTGELGLVTLRAAQHGDDTYNPAKAIDRSFLVKPFAAGSGLSATYYNNVDFTAKALEKVDPKIDFSWGTASPDPSMGANTFSIRWDGQLLPLYNETYTFYTSTDDGVRLWVNGQLLIDQWENQGGTTHTATISLESGKKVPIRMEYYENTGSAAAKLEWSSIRQQKEVIPATNLFIPEALKQAQSITFATIGDKLTTDDPFTISASASSGLPVSLELITGPASLNGGLVTVGGIEGEVVIEATQEGDATYNAAPPVRRSFNIKSPVTSCSAEGNISATYWFNIAGVSVADIPVNSAPSDQQLLTSFETPANTADNYAVRVRGYICAPFTGNYTFWMASDDNGELWLSTDDNPQNKTRIAFVPGWTPERDWDKYSSQRSNPLRLEEGKTYYIEALMKEGGGGDNLAVGWTLPSGAQERPIPGTYLSPYVSNEKLPQTITFPPIANKSISSPPFNVNGSASSGLGLSYEIKSGPATVAGNRITLTGATGTVVVEASQAGNSLFDAATPVSRSFSVEEATLCDVEGMIYQEIWEEIGSGNSVADIPINTTPDKTAMLTIFEIPEGAGEAYGTRVSGFICPPMSGKYIFYIASDDNGELWLSSDENAVNKRRIASVPGWTAPREWNKFPDQASGEIELLAGKLYYVEALMKEGAGGDNLSVGWRLPDGTFERPISGIHLSPSADPGKQAQSINFQSIPNKQATDPDFNLIASASSGLPVSFEKVSGPATISGATVSLTGAAGLVKIKAIQAGNDDYNPAEALQEFIVFGDGGGGCSGTGSITLDTWTNVPGREVSEIPVSTTPTSSRNLTIFEIEPDLADDYGSRIRGYICPPATGSYTFWLASDDHGELWLSTDDQPSNKRKIAHVFGWTPYRSWTFRTSQKSAAITLVEGQRYYIEALQKEGGGGDNLSVGWQLPDGTLERPVPGLRLIPYNAVAAQQSFLPVEHSQLLSDQKVKVYPNPSTGTIYFSWDGLAEAPESYQVRLCDMTGKCVKQESIAARSAQLNVAGIASGVYQILIETDQYQQRSRIMILE